MFRVLLFTLLANLCYSISFKGVSRPSFPLPMQGLPVKSSACYSAQGNLFCSCGGKSLNDAPVATQTPDPNHTGGGTNNHHGGGGGGGTNGAGHSHVPTNILLQLWDADGGLTWDDDLMGTGSVDVYGNFNFRGCGEDKLEAKPNSKISNRKTKWWDDYPDPYLKISALCCGHQVNYRSSTYDGGDGWPTNFGTITLN